MHNNHNIVLHNLHKTTLICAGQQQQCSVDRLPAFGDRDDRNAPDSDRFQAIVPAYTFQCSGRVTEWRACVYPSDGDIDDFLYYIQFQVWRSTGIEGCYELVGYNTPLDDDFEQEGSEEFLFPPGDMNDPPDYYCVVLPVRESQQIEFQAGDVIGYYVDLFEDGRDEDDGGIQWIKDDEVTVYYRDDLPREDIKSHYAIGISPSVCGFEISGTATSDLYSLSNTANSAPIISLSIGKSEYPQLIIFC